ncbi:hypothetical protein AS189_19165 (plasmid) [Arthrobacter alpinus]|uniref:Uncharacterized protein n=2 Tax=Arthrobacter alpinus TaxID=656366 RepID=A0A0S2M4Q5_9MICC|nr:hypothetical protein AS189_19165 [Arthrobacter alpinus]
MKVAAFSVATGTLDPNFKPVVNGPVRNVAVSNDTVYVGGAFGNAGGQTRSNLAAFTRSSGALLPWTPKVDDIVETLWAAPDNSRILIGGRFQNLDGSPIVGIGAVDGNTGHLNRGAADPPQRQLDQADPGLPN